MCVRAGGRACVRACACVCVCVCVCVWEREKFCVFIVSNFIFGLDVQYAHVNVTRIMQCQTKSVWEFVFRSAVQRKALHLSLTLSHTHTLPLSPSLSQTHTHTHTHISSLSLSLSHTLSLKHTLSLCVRETDEPQHNTHSLPLFSLKCQK